MCASVSGQKLSIIVPVYNEEQTIGEVIDRVCRTNVGDLDVEIIIANDGSDDRTRRIIDASPWRDDPRLRVYDSVINLGKGAAIRLGLRYATGDILLIQDADLELNPDEYGRLLAPILDGRAKVVYGSRFLDSTSHIPPRTRLANRFLTIVTNVLYGSRLSDMETAYKVFRREVLNGMRLRSVGFDFEPEFTAKLLLAGYDIHEVAITYRPRRADEGKKIRWVDGMDALYALVKCRVDRR